MYEAKRLAIRQLDRPVTALGIQKIQQAGGAAFISILADVARILRLFQIAGGVELHDFVVALHRLISIGYIGKHGITGRLLLVPRLE